MKDKFKFLVVENAPDVCEGIIKRMEPYKSWNPIGYCMGIKDACSKVVAETPDLIFLDWGLNGGSAYEILQVIQNIKTYNPYIIFNTGFQKDNPEIPQELINNYKVDKYLVKPLWEHLRMHLSDFIKEAEQKSIQQEKEYAIWVTDDNGHKVLINLSGIVCICQHPADPRCRNIFLVQKEKEVTIPLQWYKCFELLKENNIDFFITKSRSHLVTRNYIVKWEKPYVRLQNIPFKIEVVKESQRDFEKWLLQK
jgi:CheY-like chemotaxis protein